TMATAYTPVSTVEGLTNWHAKFVVNDIPASIEQGRTEELPPVSTKQKAANSSSTKLSRRDRVVLDHLPLVKAIAVRVHENLPVHVDLDDLIHAGILGLFDAASKYDPDKKEIFHI